MGQLKAIYEKADVILITSEREGFPMALMEGMAYGGIPVSTPVGDIPKHIQTNQTGFLTSAIESTAVIDEMTAVIRLLIEDATKRKMISRNAYEYARLHFSKEEFIKQYRDLLIS